VADLAVWVVASSSGAFISSVRKTHVGGILQVKPKDGLRYTPLTTNPASREAAVGGTAFWAWGTEDVLLDEAGWCWADG
jgi:hypothetical protein